VGAPALTTLGMGKDEMREIAAVLKRILSSTRPASIGKGEKSRGQSKSRYHIDPDALEEARSRVADLLVRFPLYPELDLDVLQEAFA